MHHGLPKIRAFVPVPFIRSPICVGEALRNKDACAAYLKCSTKVRKAPNTENEKVKDKSNKGESITPHFYCEVC